MTRQEIIKLLAVVKTAYQNFQVSEQTDDLWHEIIGGVDFELAAKSLKIYISQGKDFAPTPGHIKQIAISLTKQIEHNETSSEAWDQVVRIACGMGRPDAPKPDLSLRAMKAANQTGWNRIRYAHQEKDLPFVRRDFIKAYEDMEERDENVTQLQELPALAQNLIHDSRVRAISDTYPNAKNVQVVRTKRIAQ